MPHILHHKQVIKQLENLIKRRKVEAALRSLLHEDSDEADDGQVVVTLYSKPR